MGDSILDQVLEIWRRTSALSAKS